ncbi:hypothetical protein LguiB_009635 [Lonicera macranthoides]
MKDKKCVGNNYIYISLFEETLAQCITKVSLSNNSSHSWFRSTQRGSESIY